MHYSFSRCDSWRRRGSAARRAPAALAALLAILSPATGPVLAGEEQVGYGPWALPAGFLVPLALVGAEGTAGAVTVGYGYTESVLDDHDEHHRLAGDLAASLTPVEWLAAAVRFDSRYDWHETGTWGRDSGALGQTRLLLRGSGLLGNGLYLGGEGAALFPAAETPGRSLNAATFDLNLLGSYLPGAAPLALGARVGFRADGSAGAPGDPDRLSLPDRLALGFSDANAVLLGLCASWRIRDLEVVGEWSWDVMVGKEAVAAAQSPMRITAGGRLHLGTAIELSLAAGASPLGRPEVPATGPLVVVEPLLTVQAGLGFRIPFPERQATAAVAASEPGALRGRVLTEQGEEIAGARIVVAGESLAAAVTDARGEFTLRRVETGEQVLGVEASGFHARKVPVRVAPGENEALTIVMKARTATVRGVVHAPGGAPIAGATVEIGTGEAGLRAETDAAGRYELAGAPPGEIELRIRAEGWQEQRRTIDTGSGEPPEIDVELRRPLPEGQIRGQVSGFDGLPIAARITVEPIGAAMTADAGGSFEIDVPPGEYTVVVRAPGYIEQRRPARVEQNGVTVLVVNLQGEKR